MKNPIKKWMDEQRYYGDIHRDKKKYHRGSPNKHEFDDEIEDYGISGNTRDRDSGLDSSQH